MEAEAAAKRARESSDAAVAAGIGKQAGISTVIPGWFSEISPMWSGSKFFNCNRVSNCKKYF
ncbi:hypothetical protein E2562_037137 [Oryza meyeriana var. granulata]|uniref:Uncharacterized protein n=1 Tax=Oryza meyeriana var. granulata TaxID=110450 RepID=A0A6G1CW10_9ORYZ|nr:hypothetical protein E2562_037137 [Oryza meyeriana var. granulata]